MTDEDTVTICPECKQTNIRNRTPRSMASPTDDGEEFRCNDCGARFDEPETRPAKHPAGAGIGSPEVSKLASMNPDDVPALGGDEDAA